MENLFKYILYIHITAGTVSLITFWLPVFTKKGASLHRKSGQVYVNSMYAVVITAIVLSVMNALKGETNIAIYLGFLSLLTLNPIHHGMAVLSNKRNMSTRYRTSRLVLDALLASSGLFLVVYGLVAVQQGFNILFIFFGIIGITSLRDIYSLVKNQDYNWFQDHYKGLITSGIAAYTAFLAFGGRQFLQDILPGIWQIVPWILPTVIGVIAMRITDRIYRSKGIIA